MFSQYFGQYLLNEKILTAQQLFQAMEHERLVHLKLGVLAINAGFMNAKQVETVHQLQRTRDKRFGELAIEQGYLNVKQLDDLLNTQQRRHLSLSQAVLDLGYLTLNQLEKALDNYKNASGMTGEQWQLLNSNNFEQNLRLILDFKANESISNAYYDYIALLHRNIIRFLNEEAIIYKNAQVENISGKWILSQKITGDLNIFTALVMDDPVLLEMARRYSSEEMFTIDELTKDSTAEFLNLVNGIFCINASDAGVDLDLQPQEVVQDDNRKAANAWSIPIKLSFGKFNLILFITE